MIIWRVIFAAAAVFNGLVGGALIAVPDMILAQAGLPIPHDYFYMRTVGLLIAVFGLGYAMAAMSPQRNRPVILLGLIGKAFMPIISWLYASASLVPMSTFYLSLGDLAFVLLFAIFLLRTKPL